jgi:hypothetical protein
MFCKHADVFGRPGEGVHSTRIGGYALPLNIKVRYRIPNFFYRPDTTQQLRTTCMTTHTMYPSSMP